ncbi:MAG: Menaquinone-cytochrome C reductase iron-sulfur subunit, partial [uncultured Solirubrobacteraceae bacterium]
ARPPQDKEQVHPRPTDPRGVRGGDRHAPAPHDRHRERRGRRRRGRVHASGDRLRRRPDLRGDRAAVAGRRRRRGVPERLLRPEGHRGGPGDRRGRQHHGVRPPPQPGDRPRARGPVQRLRRPDDALHAPRLPHPLRRRGRALHLPVPRRRVRLPRLRGRRPARPSPRPLLHPRARGPRRGRPALLRQPRAAPVLPAGPGRAARRRRPVPVPVPSVHEEARGHL